MRILSIAPRALRLPGVLALLPCAALAAGDPAGAATDPSRFALEPPPVAETAPDVKELRINLGGGGLRLESPDKDFTFRVIGRIHNDWVWQSADDDVKAGVGDSFADGTRFRRARMGIDGRMFEHFLYKAEFDFANGDASFRDVYVGTDLYSHATIRVGSFKEPFGLEQLTSSNNISFVERSLPDVFTPSFNTGLGLGGSFADERMAWGLGVFRESDDFGNDVGSSSGNYAFTGRVTGLPMYQDKGRRLVHLGTAITHRKADEVRYRARPENSFAPRLVDTMVLADVDDQTILGAEAAWVHGSLSLQGEYMLADVSSELADDPRFSGWYAMISYILTGEHRSYSTRTGTFGGVRPEKSFGKEGMGAWELALRYSTIDLDDGMVMGGELDNVTAGVNWYLNPNARVMLNYVRSDVDRSSFDGDAEAVLLRFQVAW